MSKRRKRLNSLTLFICIVFCITWFNAIEKANAAGKKNNNGKNIIKGDVILFGSYEQDANAYNGKEPIEWIVLDVKNGKALLMSKYALDGQQYNSKWESVTWENCSLRKWLNSDFYKNAFSKTERKAIKKTKIKNADNPIYGTEGGKDTKDKVFLLSMEDMDNYNYNFVANYMECRCAPTEYADLYCGVYSSYNNKTKNGERACSWWLRTPGDYSSYVLEVDDLGKIDKAGEDITKTCGVRPVLWMDTKASCYSVAVDEDDVSNITDKQKNVMSAKKGEVICFGKYEQDNKTSNGKEDIEWIVLDIEDDKALVLSKHVLDCKPFDEIASGVCWENCSLRKWLNEEFYDSAFSDDEKKKICESLLINSDNWVFSKDGGEDTYDKVFLLSQDDINKKEYGFNSNRLEDDINRRCSPTKYALSKGAYESKYYLAGDGNKSCWWWLRSPGGPDGSPSNPSDASTNIMTVFCDGYVVTEGFFSWRENGGVRPAMYIKLK